MVIKQPSDAMGLLRAERLRARLSPQKAADRAGLPRNTYASAEERDPRLSTVIKMAAAFGYHLYLAKPPTTRSTHDYWGVCPCCGLPFVGARTPPPPGSRPFRVFTRECPMCGEAIRITATANRNGWVVPVDVQRGGNGDV